MGISAILKPHKRPFLPLRILGPSCVLRGRTAVLEVRRPAAFKSFNFQMNDKNVHIFADDLVNPLLAALIVNAWYAALNIHMAEKGALTSEEKKQLLFDVLHWQGKIRKLIEESKDLSLLPESQMRERLKQIFES